MSNNKYLRQLLSPITINGLNIPNRIMMSGMHLGMESVENIFERMAHFYSIRAEGKTGLILVGGCSPNKAGQPRLKGAFSVKSDSKIASHRVIVDSVHKHGSKIGLQICHFGRESFHGNNVSASSSRAEGILYTPKEMTDETIEETIFDFAKGALRARKAGYDAVEIVGSQGFLLHQFLSPSTNFRTDRWGGCFENRKKFPMAVIKAVRKMVGSDFPVILRFPGLDLINDGLSFEDMMLLFNEIKTAGVVDLFNIGIGWHDSKVPTISMSVPRGAFSPIAGFFKKQSGNIPIAVSNRINDPFIAEEILVNGMADVIAMGRPLLADPYFVKKAMENKYEKINTCIACNQSCLDHALKGKRVSCMVNPGCGSKDEGKKDMVEEGKRIGVVGGGIAGMSAAVFLSEKGHDVFLFEKEKQLGGHLILASSIPDKVELHETVRYFKNCLIDNNVKVYFDFDTEHFDLSSLDLDILVVASGKPPRTLPVEGCERNHVYNFEEILKYNMPVQYPVVIVGGGAVSVNLAIYLSERQKHIFKSSYEFLDRYLDKNLNNYSYEMEENYKITLLQRSGKKLAGSIGPTTRGFVIRRFKNLNIDILKNAELKKISEKYVEVECKGEKRKIEANTVIWAIGQSNENDVERKFSKNGMKCYTLGVGKRRTDIKTMILDSYELSKSI